MGCSFSFQMMKPNQRQPFHLTLAHTGHYVLVTDEPFVQPHLIVAQRLSRCGPTLFVDTSCTLPARLVLGSDCKRAYQFRDRTKKRREERLRAGYPASPLLRDDLRSLNGDGGSKNNITSFLPFNATSLLTSSINEIITGSCVDFSVAPVCNTRGGQSSAAQRWGDFLRRGLKTYAKRRNDPLSHHSQGVSRMSAYLNLGMMSPFRMAHQVLNAMEINPKVRSGASKFLDEFIVWREMAYCYCYHVPNHLDVNSALPFVGVQNIERSWW